MTALSPDSDPVDATSWDRLRREVVRDAAAVGVAVGTYGISYGALGTSSGLSVLQTCALSVLAFTGGSQFALIGVIGSGGAAASGVATALMLGFRNLLYGLRLAPTLQVHGAVRLPAAQLVIDETTAMTISQTQPRASRLAFWATGLMVYTLWNVATLVGAVGASALGDPKRFGLDAAVGAAFLGPAVAAAQARDDLVRRGRRGRGRAGADPVPVARPARARGRAGRRRRRRRAAAGGAGGLVIWAAVLVTSVGCYLLKLAGLSVPERWLSSPRVRAVTLLLPVALLAALTVVQVFATGQHLVIDARAAGFAFAIVALVLRAPFIVVVVGAAAVAALLRAVT